MFTAKIPLDRRLRVEDFLRSVGYLGLALWTVLYAIHPSEIVDVEVQPWVQWLWLGISFTGAILAAVGCMTKIDIKLELPGILFLIVGPLLYFAVNTYRVFTIAANEQEHPSGLIALVVYALVPVLLLLPRIFRLYTDALSSRKSDGDEQAGVS